MGAKCCGLGPQEPPPPYGATNYETPTSRSPRYETSHYKPSRYEPPRYEPPRYESSRYEASCYESSRYGPSEFKTPHYKPPQHKPPQHKPPHHEPTYQTVTCYVTAVLPASTTRQRSISRKVVNKVEAPKTEAHDHHQYELIILGLPNAAGHTPHISAKLVATALGTSISNGDIIDAYRLPGKAGKAQPLVIRFSSIELRDTWIALKKKKTNLSANQIHHAFQNHKISIMERLTPENRKLYHKVKQFSRENNYRFVWVKHGEIYLRKKEGAKGHLIRCDNDLEKFRH